MNLFSPAEVAKNYIAIGKAKVSYPTPKMLLLAIMAGAFISLGGVASTAVAVSVPEASVGKFLGALVFPGGLAMVLIAGSDLFTGNCLLSIPLLEKEITLKELLKDWVVVYFGNMIGATLVAAGVVYGHTISMFNNGLAQSVIYTAASKSTISFGDALIRGIFCNFLVCLAVWVSFAAKDVAGKVVGLYLPIVIFILCGFEHCVANMYYITAGFFAKGIPAYAQVAQNAGIDMSVINLKNYFITNLVPVTIGNIIGGSVCVGAVYWFLYLRKHK